MKVKVTHQRPSLWKTRIIDHFFMVEVDGEKGAYFLGEPEDASISRDFSDVWSIPGLMKAAYDAGKNGEAFIIEECESDDVIWQKVKRYVA